jgi:hypothetical protein
MAKSKGARLTKKVAGRKKRKSRPIKNPETGLVAASSGFLSQTWSEIANAAVPGLVAYGCTRAVGRMAYKIGKRRSPAFAKHAGPLASVLFAGGASYAARKFDYLAKWDLSITVGAWIAAIQSVVQTYIPQYGWILNDWHMDDVLPMQAQVDENGQPLPETAKRRARPGLPAGQPVPDAQLPASGDDDFSDIPGLNDEGMNVGIFSGGLAN